MKKITIVFIVASICMQPSRNIHAGINDYIVKRDLFAILTLINATGLIVSGVRWSYCAKQFRDLKKDSEQENLCQDIKEDIEAQANEYRISMIKWGSATIIELILTIGFAYGMNGFEDRGYKTVIGDENGIDLDDLL